MAVSLLSFNTLEFASYFSKLHLPVCYDGKYTDFDLCQAHVEGGGHDHVLFTLLGFNPNNGSKVYVRFTCAHVGNSWDTLSSIYFYCPDDMKHYYKVELFDKTNRTYFDWCSEFINIKTSSYDELFDAYDKLSSLIVSKLASMQPGVSPF